jgi:hypothetical protein
MLASEQTPLPELHRAILARLGAAIGNLRLIAIGAPFTEELVRIVEVDLLDALQATRQANRLTEQLASNLSISRSCRENHV